MLMGVSKAILEMVIFCHQEDSNWPLTGADAELKKRFDLIFSADRYRKGLTELKDQQKAWSAKIKVSSHLFSCCWLAHVFPLR